MDRIIGGSDLQKEGEVKHIRPCELFQHLNGNRDVVYRIPSHRGVESETIMSLETLLLVTAARITNAKSILELGTCLGYNALQLARNTDSHIVTVDRECKPRVFEGCPEEKRIDSVKADIADFQAYSFDMVFADVNYTHETVERATEIAFGCNPKVIAWHDYGHPLLPHVKPFLDSLELKLFHVEDSWLVFWFSDGL